MQNTKHFQTYNESIAQSQFQTIYHCRSSIREKSVFKDSKSVVDVSVFLLLWSSCCACFYLYLVGPGVCLCYLKHFYQLVNAQMGVSNEFLQLAVPSKWLLARGPSVEKWFYLFLSSPSIQYSVTWPAKAVMSMLMSSASSNALNQTSPTMSVGISGRTAARLTKGRRSSFSL